MGGEIKQFRNFVFGEYCGICLFALWRFAINFSFSQIFP